MSHKLVLQAINPQAVADVEGAAPDEAILSTVVDTFAALADPTRVRILYALIRRPLCVRDLAITVGLSESAVSHQLRLLRDRQLVRSQRHGNVIEYAVQGHHVVALFKEAEYHADHQRSGIPDHP